MRSPLGVLLLGIVSVACGGEAPPPQAPPFKASAPIAPPTSPNVATEIALPPPAAVPPLSAAEQRKETRRLVAEALNAHDAKKLASAYTETAVIKASGMPDDVGRAAIANGVQELFDAISNFKYGVTRVWNSSSIVVTEWVGTGTHSGDFAGVRATEKPVGWTALSVSSFTDGGLIKEEHVYWDTLAVLSQIGAPAGKGKPRPIPQLPSGNPETHNAQGTLAELRNIELVKQLSAARNARSDTDLFGLYAETLERWDVGTLGPAKGRDETNKGYKSFVAAFPDSTETVNDAWSTDDWVVAESTTVGTHKASFAGIAPTKKQVSVHECHVYQLKDGKIARDWSFASTPELTAQLVPAKARAAAANDPAPKNAPPKKK